MNKEKFSISKRLQSFKFALNGLAILIREEHNARIHLIAAVIVFFAGVLVGLSSYEWIALVWCISSVITLEIINSAIENVCDFISPQRHDDIKKIKDLAAASVLITATASVVIGLIIFIPKISELL